MEESLLIIMILREQHEYESILQDRILRGNDERMKIRTDFSDNFFQSELISPLLQKKSYKNM